MKINVKKFDLCLLFLLIHVKPGYLTHFGIRFSNGWFCLCALMSKTLSQRKFNVWYFQMFAPMRRKRALVFLMSESNEKGLMT